jgi:transmembrane sensor
MQPPQLKLFLKKFSAGINTEEEHHEFIEWLKTAPVEDIETILDEYHIINEEKGSVSDIGHLNLLSNIEAALDQYELGKEKNDKKNKIISGRFFLRIAAACFVIFISGAVLYFTLKNNSQGAITKLPAQQVKTGAAPGSNKAILTLSGGATIILDDTQNGHVARQGGTEIAKSANGKLVYNVVKGAPAEVVFNTLTTPRGGQFKLVLPDGSEVWLNAASSIKYPTAFINNERKVEISGEVYFEIVHNEAKPFKVIVNGMEVKVLGTHFNINAYNDEAAVKTTLLEGSVSLTKGHADIKLKPGQQAQVSDENIKVIDNIDTDQVLAWKNGYFSFKRADLQTVMRQIARWYDVEISYEGKIPERQFGGKIDRNSNASEVLKILEESKVHFRIEDKKIIVRP